MELPVVEFPSYIEEMSNGFTHLFKQERQLTHFKRLMTGYVVAEKKTIAHMNSLFTYHTNQSNLNRFVTSSDWNMEEMNRVKINMINEVEGDGVVVIDDYIIRKHGKEIYGTDWHYDHSKGRMVFGWQITDCVLSGKGIYPLLSTVYLKKRGRWVKQGRVFKSKIEIQMDQLTQLVNMDLCFSCVVMDVWYFCKTLTKHIGGFREGLDCSG
ncbi:MAG: transposase [Candidatus Hydrothermae bacterium]|nr:transposase [Candidatus Hydrothermae bacterium]